MKRTGFGSRRHRSALLLLALSLPLGTTSALTLPASAAAAAEANTAQPEASSEASAFTKAAKSGKRVEIIDRREETVEVFANPNGTTTRRSYAHPVWSKLEGVWRKADPTLAKRSDGTIAPVSPTFAITFSRGGGEPLATMAKGGKKLALTWPSALPEPVLNGNTATYQSVVPGVDLKVIAEVDGFAEHLVIHNAEAAANPALKKIKFGITSQGVTLAADSKGNLAAKDKSGKVVFSAPSPKMWEQPKTKESKATAAKSSANGAPADGAGAEQPQSAAVAVNVSGNSLTLKPDPALLAKADQFPLIVDPVFTGGYRERWAVVYSATPSSSYLNGSGWNSDNPADEPRVGHNGTGRTRSFFAMNTTGLEGSTIIHATFAVEETHSWGCEPADAGPTELWATDSIATAAPTWNGQEGSNASFWNTKLDADSFAHGNPTFCPGDQGHDFQSTALTSHIQQAATNNLGFVTLGLRADAGYEGGVSSYKRFRNNPVLQIDYNHKPTVDTATAYEGTWAPSGMGNVPVACGGAIGNNGLALTAKVTDKDGGQVAAHFSVYNSSGTAVSFGANPSADIVSSGQTASVTMPYTSLANGTYTWKVYAKDNEATSSATTGACAFTVDRVGPTGHVIVTTPSGGDISTMRFPARKVAQLKLKLDPPITDLAGFCYAVDGKLSTSSTRCHRGTWVDAQADGTALITVTPAGRPSSILYSTAYDKAGNHSPIDSGHEAVTLNTTPYDFVYAFPNTPENPVGYPHDLPGDVDGDGYADLLATTPTGALFLYRGDGTGKIAAGQQVGRSGWTGALFTHRGDFTGIAKGSAPDGYEDFIVRLSDNKLWLYPNNGSGVPLDDSRTELAYWDEDDTLKWARLRNVLSAGNIDGKPGDDLITVECEDAACTNAELWLYSGQVIGSEQSPNQTEPFDMDGRTKIGTSGWGRYTNLSVGDVNGDGVADMVGRNPELGQLYLFPGKLTNGVYSFQSAILYGSSGWEDSKMPSLTSPGNAQGTVVKDIPATVDGEPVLYRQFQPTAGQELGDIWATTSADSRTITYVDDQGVSRTTTCPTGCLLFYPGWTPGTGRTPKLVGVSGWATLISKIH